MRKKTRGAISTGATRWLQSELRDLSVPGAGTSAADTLCAFTLDTWRDRFLILSARKQSQESSADCRTAGVRNLDETDPKVQDAYPVDPYLTANRNGYRERFQRGGRQLAGGGEKLGRKGSTYDSWCIGAWGFGTTESFSSRRQSDQNRFVHHQL